MKLGIDFGTTHTSAAWFDGQTVQFVPLDPHSANPALLRSMIYITRQQEVFLGVAAVQRFLQEDTGRQTVLQEKVVGTIENTVAQQYKSPSEPDGPITIIYDVIVDEDIGANGRLLQSIKTGLRSESYRGTKIFDRYYTVQELVALILRHVRTQAEKRLNQEIRCATIGRPVHLAEDQEADQQAEVRLRQAASLAGLEEVTFVAEPVAAAHFYLAGVQQAETVLIFDFGGGTLDFTILRSAAEGNPRILATHGVSLGGDDLDSAIMRGSVAPHLGTTSAIDRNFDGRPLPFPEDLAELLNHWQTIPMLSRRQYLAVIERAKRYGEASHQFAALEALVTQNRGFALFEQIEQSKRTLSSQGQTTLTMQLDGQELAIDLTRPAFNLLIGAEMGLARQGVREVTRLAGLCADQINTLVTTGGSSVIPAFQRMLTREFSEARLVQSNAFTSVVSGLALSAAQ